MSAKSSALVEIAIGAQVHEGPTAEALRALANQESRVDVGALLAVTTPAGSPPGGLQVIGAVGVDALTEGTPAPGVRSWILQLAPGFQPVPHFLFAAFVNNAGPNLIGGCGIRFRSSGPFPPGFLEVYLVDSASPEVPVDPANVLGIIPGPVGPNLVSFGVLPGGAIFLP
jgi:hypothetical protein